ncbi:MAG: glycosyl hydrolase family 17 protein [Candidatus Hydrogenedentes bacterium]|nr:glycosyl hydrolase family 17 protein [Candidatus Hydrogenedentota bacterium]
MLNIFDSKNSLPALILFVKVIVAVLVSACVKYPLHGINFSPFTGENQHPNWTVITEEELQQKLGTITPFTNWVRTFGCKRGLEKVAELARARGKKTAIGAWISADLNANNEEIQSLIQLLQKGVVDLAVVGSETLLRGDLTEAQLISYINQVKAHAKGVPVTTGEIYQNYISRPALVEACDVVFVNIYPYWEGIDVNYAMYYFDIRFEELQKAVGNKKIIISEVGWPSEGNTIGEAVPTLENARFFFINFVSWAEAKGAEYFYFEAFDEPWKWTSENPQEAHWGIFDKSGKMKEGFLDVFRGVRMGDNWSGTEKINGEGTPQIELTYIPPIGSEEFLVGKVSHVIPRHNRIAVYIFNGGGWWNKPYWNTPTILIMPDGEWKCDIVTHPSDVNATKIAVFLIPKEVAPPLMSGEPTIPQSFYESSLANVEVSRS